MDGCSCGTRVEASGAALAGHGSGPADVGGAAPPAAGGAAHGQSGGGLDGSPRIIRPGRNSWREADVRDSGVLIDAADYYRAFYAAAGGARQYILMSGWQFDSGVKLLRGAEAVIAGEVRLLRFLSGLCKVRPALRIFVLAWDFHMVFALEREWMQRVLFHWLTPPNLRFRFDTCGVEGAHHQKFVVIDGALAFLGGIDICESRWDDRRHLEHNPLRRSRGRLSKPYHDVQACLVGGQAPRALAELFAERWRHAAGEPLELPPPTPDEWRLPPDALRLGPGRVALSRTDPGPDEPPVREIEALLLDAIGAAEQLIYLETQYFSSRAIAHALRSRMAARERPRLDIAIVVNERAEAMKEEIAVGLRQARIIEDLREVAAASGHALGVYHSRGQGGHDVFPATYIHSKLAIVDDRFLAVGSANLTNRSMAIDRELGVAWEATSPAGADRALMRAIRRLRVSLLAEHSGTAGRAGVRALVPVAGLVARLERLAAEPGSRLQRHGPPTDGQQLALRMIDPEMLPFDPGGDAAGRDEPPDEPSRRKRETVGGIATLLRRHLGLSRRRT